MDSDVVGYLFCLRKGRARKVERGKQRRKKIKKKRVPGHKSSEIMSGISYVSPILGVPCENGGGPRGKKIERGKKVRLAILIIPL